MSQPASRHPLTWRWPFYVAFALSLLFAFCELAGLRDSTAALTGVSLPSFGEFLAGLAYVIAHLAFVFLAPVLVLAACGVLGLRWFLGRWRPVRREDESV